MGRGRGSAQARAPAQEGDPPPVGQVEARHVRRAATEGLRDVVTAASGEAEVGAATMAHAADPPA